jgi:histone deacetylase complex regulatory component SIN3
MKEFKVLFRNNESLIKNNYLNIQKQFKETDVDIDRVWKKISVLFGELDSKVNNHELI